MSLPVIPLLHLGLQGFALSTCGWLLLRLVPRDARHRAWTAAISLLACTLLPPLLMLLPQPITTSSPAPESNMSLLSPLGDWRIRLDAATASAMLATAPDIPLPFPHSRHWQHLLAGTWLTGSALLLLAAGRRLHRSLRWHRSLRPLTASERLSLTTNLAQPDLLVSDQPINPCLAGLFRPVIVVPASAFTSWTPEHWRWVLEHESEHYRSGDHLMSPLISFSRILWWWNPFARSLASHWSLAREEVCDATALRPADDSGEAADYARFLLDLAASQPPVPLASLAMATSRPARRLKQRITALLEHRTVAPRLHPVFPLLALFTLALVSLGVRSLGVETTPNPRESPQNPNLEKQPKSQPQFDDNPKQVYLSTKWLEFPTSVENTIPPIGDLSTMGPVLTDPQFQVVIRALSQVKGVDLLSAPGVTVKSGQRATVEVLREVQGEPSSKPDFAGVRSDLTAAINRDGYQIEVSISADMGVAFQAGKRVLDWSAKSPSPLKITHLRASKTAMLNDGETLFLPIGTPEPDRKVFLFVTASLIQPIGKKTNPDQLQQSATDAAKTPSHSLLKATPKMPIRIVAKIFDEQGAEALEAILPASQQQTSPQRSATSAIAPPAAKPPPGPLALGRVMTDKQFAALVTSLERDNRVQVTDVPVERVITGEATMARINAEQFLQVTPLLGQVAQTIDLSLMMLKPDDPPLMTTELSIWSGQTVILYGVLKVDTSGKPTHSRAICITAEIDKSEANK